MPVAEFLRGLAAGVVVMALAAAATRLSRRRPPGAATWATGMTTAIAALGAIGWARHLAPGLIVGLAGLTAASAAGGSRALRRPMLAASLLAAASASLVAVDASSTGWVRAVVVGAAAAGSLAASRTDDVWGPSGVTPALYAVTAFGVFAAVPDTEEAGALLGACIPGALAGWPLGRARLGRAGAGGATGLLVWVAAVGGRGRTPSIVGAVACLGLLVTLAVGRWLIRRWPGLPGPARAGPVPILVAHTSVVYVASRVAGVSHHLRVAVPVAAAAGAAAVVAGTVLARR